MAAIAATDAPAAATIKVTLQQIGADSRLIDSLTDHGYGTDRNAPYQVSKWQQFWQQGHNLWRLKIWNLERTGTRYRIVYCYDPDRYVYTVLGIVDRDWDYADDHPFTLRILAAYENL